MPIMPIMPKARLLGSGMMFTICTAFKGPRPKASGSPLPALRIRKLLIEMFSNTR
jgi:hypothetical protein